MRIVGCLAANTATTNLDSIAGRNANFDVYHNPDTDLFEFLPWDLNMAFGGYRASVEGYPASAEGMLYMDIYNPTDTSAEHVLIDRILAVPEYVALYEVRIRSVVEEHFNSANMDPRIDELYAFIRSAVYADPHKLDSSEHFDQSIERDVPDDEEDYRRVIGLKRFVAERSAHILQQLDQQL